MSTPPPESTPPHELPAMVCSFCGKTQREVRKLIAGPSVYICDECITLCNDIIAEEVPRAASQPREAIHRRDALLGEVRRALESAFPDRAAELVREVEGILPLGYPLICMECSTMGRAPNPIPADYICPELTVDTWKALGYQPLPVQPAAAIWLQILRKEEPAEFVILAPLIVREPIRLPAR